jgi:hypothetical protein
MSGVDELRRQLEMRWAALPEPQGDAATVSELPSRTRYGDLLIGRTAAGRAVYIPFPPGKHGSFEDDRRSRAVRLTRRGFQIHGGHKWFAELLCTDHDLYAVFTTLVTDLVIRLESEHDDPVAVTLATLRAWRSLLAGSGRLLGVRQLGGLFGELIVLRRLLEANSAAASWWRGPYRERHDFLVGVKAIEVKTVLANEGSEFRVHGLEQLVPPDDGSLSLVQVKVRPSAATGQSVPQLVAELMPAAGTALEKGLAAIGYRASDVEVYRKTTFELLAIDWFEVGPGFPRVTPASLVENQLPAGISDLHYTVDLSKAGVLPATDVAVTALLGELTDG